MERSTAIKGRRALVVGGGIAGLAAAGVLARHFEAVTLLERDEYPDEPAVRPHAAQGAHVHILLAGGLYTLSRLVPDLPRWLDEMGLREGDLTHNVRTASGDRWLPKVRSGVPIRPCTRPVLEHLLLRDVRRRPNVTVRAGCKVEDLVGARVARGVRVARGGATEEIEADFVLDAAGRGSPSARWLREAGIGPAPEEIVDAGVVYSSCWFEPPGDVDDDWTVLGLSPRFPDEPNVGAVMRVTPDRMLCAVVGYGKPDPPRDPADFVARFEQFSVPEPGRLLRASRPISGVGVYGNTQNRFRHYGRLPSFVDRLAVLGDSLCALDPLYGQGMTVAALGAERLDRELDAYFRAHGRLDGFSPHFQRAMESALRLPWQMAIMQDRLWVDHFAGRRPGALDRVAAMGSARLIRTVFSDVDAFVRFMRVAHMLDAPTKLLSPKMIAAVVRGGASGGIHVDPPRTGTSARRADVAAADAG
jgi:2-polyprenyl-6-methoxyphenol hydroxylase-like FAD-dependent oxidoreductase